MFAATAFWWAAALFFCLPSKIASAWELDKTWRRNIADGVEFVHYRMIFERGPAHIFVVEVDPLSSYSLKPVIANNRIGSLEEVGSIAKRAGAVAAINGGFFDTKTNLPVGLIGVKHRLLYNQWLNRAVLGIDEKGFASFGTFRVSAELYFPDVDKSVPIHGINRPRKEGDLIVFYPEFGPSTKTNEWGVEVLCRRISPTSTYYPFAVLEPERYLIQEVNRNNTRIPSDGMVLSFHSSILKGLTWLDKVMLGEEVIVRTNLPKEWDSFPYLLGGGPMLVKEGRLVLDPAKEGFKASFNYPTARTAVGKTVSGKILIVVVDSGSKDYSIGATWTELAYAMIGLYPLSDLMGFDGGGSSTMFVDGKVVNEPKDGASRRVSNILAVVPFDEFL
jgi:exopolysaccharide biosynthesis protein